MPKRLENLTLALFVRRIADIFRPTYSTKLPRRHGRMHCLSWNVVQIQRDGDVFPRNAEMCRHHYRQRANRMTLSSL